LTTPALAICFTVYPGIGDLDKIRQPGGFKLGQPPILSQSGGPGL